MKNKIIFIVIINHKILIEFFFIYDLIIFRYTKKMREFKYYFRYNTNYYYQNL